jgi:hypothetical protein
MLGNATELFAAMLSVPQGAPFCLNCRRVIRRLLTAMVGVCRRCFLPAFEPLPTTIRILMGMGAVAYLGIIVVTVRAYGLHTALATACQPVRHL